MAQRRMFSMQIVDTDAFLEMPITTQNLYFHLGMRADDDGFVSNPKKIMKITGCGEDDIKILLAKRFLLGFESGVIVIKHWRMHNYIRKDRYTETGYLKEKSALKIKENGSYTEIKKQLSTNCQPNDTQMDTQVRLGKVRLGKVSVKQKRFIKPTPTQIQDYLDEIKCIYFTGYDFYNKYESNGWLVGKNQTPMKNWKAAVQTWISNEKRNNKKQPKPFSQQDPFQESIQNMSEEKRKNLFNKKLE